MGRITFGTADPARYGAGWAAVPRPVVVPFGRRPLCTPPEPITGPHARAFLEARVSAGVPCHRCIANVAALSGAFAVRCHFLERLRAGDDLGSAPALEPEAPPDGSLGL